MAQDLSGLYISQSFQNLVQRSASGAFNVLATATGTEFIPVSASYAISSSHAVDADTTISSSYAVSSSHAINADIAIEAEDLIITVKNISGGTLAKGTPVHAVSVTGENVDVIIASNDNASNMPAIGLLSADISNNAAGPCIIAGRDIGLDTSGLIAGSSVYVGVNGVLTSVKPTGSALIQNIGTAAKINASDGEIIIQGAGRTNDLPNIQENYLWLGDANGVPQAVISSSIVVDNAVSSSYALSASYVSGAVDAFPYTGSAQITGSLGVTGSMIVSRNEPGVNATLVIRDDAQSSFNDGPTLTFEGSNVGIIKSQTATNMQIKAERDLEIFVGQGGAGSQFKIDKTDNQGGDFQIFDRGSRSAKYTHENLSETGSIKFRHNGFDNGIAIEMNDNRMALEMYSGSAFVPIIERKVNTREINLYDSTNSTGSSGQVLSSNANGGVEWVAGGGGGAAFPFTGSAKITGSLEVVGPTTLKGGVTQTDIGFSTYFGLNSGTTALTTPASNKFSTAFGVGTLASATGGENSAFGGDVLNVNTTGTKNSSFGLGSMKSNLTGGSNSALGHFALASLQSGNNNVAAGINAGREIVSVPGNSNFTSNDSIFIGNNAYPLSNGELNQIVIGSLAEGQGSNTVVLGNSSIVSTQLRGNVNTTGSLKVKGPGDLGGANAANTIAAGGAVVAGSNNTVNNTDAAIVGGAGHTVSGDTSVIMGGESNNVNSSFSGIFAAASSTITNADTSVILGGYQQSLQGARTYLLGGNQNNISNSGAEFSGIIGGQGHSIATAITASAIIGGKNITATKNETVYVPNLEVVNGGIRIPAGGGTANPGLVITGSALNNVVTEAVISNTASIALAESNTFEFTAGAANTHVVTTNIAKGQVINIKVTQDAGGAGTLTFDPEFKFPGGTAPTLTAVAGAIDIISCVSYDGTTLLSNATQNYS